MAALCWRKGFEPHWKHFGEFFKNHHKLTLGSAGGYGAWWSCRLLVYCTFIFNIDRLARTGPVFAGFHRFTPD
ncbi:uncharacterized protein DS421_8g242460 [Arachis hypogaea]|nr:uncharacterized protein DS421_8g242460 [Arachis hypogaea]